ncbi:transcription/translation regulatory transformer protein RfaH [Kangiella profundi]|uniref:Transcription antitermination protein RfaH n=1 Tax=Kangiella profundi TaxID=1561924 RepID=A0A2K9AAP2_9GAMM|nr:transcription/translation regulatory transformer protein RfaH [Kangiella profundi]AUD78497.1 transcription/translation regulatory transformer protein RfaH [Kangiella profundi]GGF08411.1 transcription antitermination protein RfaH [Kangiella profundi]
MIDNNKGWYLVHSKPRQELRAEEHLKNQAINCVLPLIEIEKIIRGKRQFISEPLFPGYLFVELQTNGQDWSKIRSTRGVRDFVRFGGVPGRVPESVLEHLKILEIRDPAIETNAPKAGDKVVITDGPFKDLEGVFKISNGEERSIVLLTILGKATEMELENNKLRKA